MTVFEKIEAQQKGKKGTIVWTVGQHLKDICRSDPHCAELVLQDLDNPEMSIEKAERQLDAYARKQTRKGGCGISNDVAEGILRKFYGLPEASTAPELVAPALQSMNLIDLIG